MLLGISIELITGIIFLLLAYSIGKGNIKLIHSYHTGNVKESDKLAYCKQFSKGIYCIGISIIISSLFALFGYFILAVTMPFFGIVIGFLYINKAQKKYNRGWISG